MAGANTLQSLFIHISNTYLIKHNFKGYKGYRIHHLISIATIENVIKRIYSKYLQIRPGDNFHIDSLTFITQLDCMCV